MNLEPLIGQCARCGGSLTIGHDCVALFKGIEMPKPEVKVKKFVVIPKDAYEVLARRYVSLEEATEAASDACSEEGTSMMVVELRAVAARADRPVKVSRL